MLHIHNGDSTAATARKAAIPGEHLAWREALVCGPAPAGLSAEEFLRLRAKHLSEAYGVALDRCERELREQQAALSAATDHEEVVLWFEHDLFCQVQLIYLLHWFAQRELGRTKLSLICIGEFPGIGRFRGLGQLNEEQLTSLFPQRQDASEAQLQLGSKAWQAYSSPDPAELLPLMNSDLSAIPFLKRALVRHIQRFPSTNNGLGRIENVGLELIAKGYRNFKSLFPAFVRREPEYGLGDAQLYLEIKRLVEAWSPLLKLSDGVKGASLDSAQMFLSSFEITELGHAVLEGEQDFVRRNGIDYWLGGVHLEGNEAAWRWDEDAKELLVRL
jgi:hypothetical protein